VDCPSQGPGSMFQQIYHHPFLLINGVLNIAYYTGETMLYREPLGLVFLVIASLSSTFLINPLNIIFDQPTDKPLPPVVLLLGIAGAFLCVIEKPSTEKSKLHGLESPTSSHETIDTPDSAPLLPINGDGEHANLTKERVIFFVKSSFRLFVPFCLLSVTYAFWFFFQKYVDNVFHVNAFGYNALDQGLLPLYLIPWLFLVDFIPPLKLAYEDENNMKESFIEATKQTWKEASTLNLFCYRLFINARAFAYFLLAVNFDLTLVYLELTLIRVIISWLGSLVLCLLFPKFIGTTEEEKKATFSPLNIILKVAGTISITGSLILLNSVYHE